jgi:hypothetical protein
MFWIVHSAKASDLFLVYLMMGGGGHYATGWKVPGSIPDEVIGVFGWPKLSSCIMALGLTQPLAEMSTRSVPGGKGQLVV